MKILYLCDTHITAKNPASRLDDIQSTIKDKFAEVGDIIRRNKVDMVIHGGDLFHTPDVSNRFTGEIATIFQSYGVPIYVVPGNHDIYGYNIDTLYNTKLGLLHTTGVIKILDRMHPLLINDNGKKIGIEGQEYHQHIDENMIDDFRINNLNVDFSMLITHSMLLDHEFFVGVKHTVIDNVQTAADLVVSGHYHPGFKEREANGVWFYNPGSMLRIENTVENQANRPKVIIFDIDAANASFTADYVELQSAKPGKEVFVEKVSNAQYKASLQTFHEKLKQSQFKGIDIIQLINEYAQNNNEDEAVTEAVKDMMNKFAVNVAVDNGFVSSNGTVYITKVEIFNFQAHAHKVVDFIKGLNVIKGESNSGKTAILRAIYWCLYDKPNGSDFIRTGAKSAKVRLHLSNGYIIERKRNRSTSGSYNLIDPTGDIQEFKGFSNNIPVEITNAHQMPEVKINGVSYRINVASQLDAPFLLGNTPNERASLIGSIVNADRADEAKKEFAADKRRFGIEKGKLKESLEGKEDDLKAYDHLPKLKKSIDVIEMAIDKLDADEAKIKQYEDVYNAYTQSKTAIAMVKSRLSAIQIPDKELVDDYRNKVNKVEEMSKLLEDYHNLLITYKDVVRRINLIPDLDAIKKLSVELHEVLDKITNMNSLLNERKQLSELSFEFNYDLDTLKSSTEEYRTLVGKIETGSKLLSERKVLESTSEDVKLKIASINMELAALAKSKEEKMTEIRKEKVICPTCHQEMSAEVAITGGC